MDETYRMLGRERQADLDREAASRRLAAALPPARKRLTNCWSPSFAQVRRRLATRAWVAAALVRRSAP